MPTQLELAQKAYDDVNAAENAIQKFDFNGCKNALTRALGSVKKVRDELTNGAAKPAPAPAPAPTPAAVTPVPVDESGEASEDKPPVIPQAVPDKPLPSPVAMAPFNNGKPANGATWFGASLGSGIDGSGWASDKDIDSMVTLGVKAIRYPLKRKYCYLADGSVNEWVLRKLISNAKRAISKGMAFVLDDHSYSLFTEPAVAKLWVDFAAKIEAGIGGPNPLFGIELQNEPGSGSKDLTAWTEPLRQTIRAIRASGYQGYIFAGAGDWNNATFLDSALAEVERTGGAVAMDPLSRTIYTMHDYWNKDSDPGKTRNDQGAAVDGTIDIAKRYDPALTVARRLGVKVVMSEIGGGISPSGPLPAYQGKGKDGRQLQEEYIAYAKANEDVLIGTWWWMAGKVGAGYRHKIEAGNEHTKSLQAGLWA